MFYFPSIPLDLLQIIGDYAGDRKYKIVFALTPKRGYLANPLVQRRNGKRKHVLRKWMWREISPKNSEGMRLNWHLFKKTLDLDLRILECADASIGIDEHGTRAEWTRRLKLIKQLMEEPLEFHINIDYWSETDYS